jgi:hypothetical protein
MRIAIGGRTGHEKSDSDWLPPLSPFSLAVPAGSGIV